MLKFLIHTVFISLLVFAGTSVQAQVPDSLFASANKLYQQEKYIEALEQYQNIEKLDLESASLYFNMANIYYRTNQVAPAIYYYEKALKLNPNDKDVRFNLGFANNMILDNIEPIPKSLWQKFMDGIILRFTYETWSKIAVALAFLFAFLFLMYHFSYSTGKKRFYFITSILSVIFVTTSLFFAYRNKHHMDTNVEAIIFYPAAEVKNAPTKSSDVYFELHEGTKVLILETLDNWKKIKIADGKMGWIDTAAIKEI
ncbi:tetratricopeptide repeat protein [Lutimonas halocynthiae]|uniref:tetratricopeptide repeat protein n=1 Tax=Lutimonas halocynthiae TaxID=1446477 RepID=UPI0025B57C10|nr:tetratricopeptide repeat protein [Lutimonas halocynthiae]MDN3641617.1 tetratricopeptide repeat protein [Lutimonas halocynthiae]